MERINPLFCRKKTIPPRQWCTGMDYNLYIYVMLTAVHIYSIDFVGTSQADWAGLEKAPRWAKICSKSFQTKACLDFAIHPPPPPTFSLSPPTPAPQLPILALECKNVYQSHCHLFMAAKMLPGTCLTSHKTVNSCTNHRGESAHCITPPVNIMSGNTK